jgi:hypothetical protein
MSEYQYYEFQAIDRRLSDKEMQALRSHSTRAQITPTSFVNEYSFGSFKGDEDAWMDKYFDAFLYVANYPAPFQVWRSFSDSILTCATSPRAREPSPISRIVWQRFARSMRASQVSSTA